MDIKIGDTVEIETMQQIADMTPDQFAVFHKDLAHWHCFIQGAKATNDAFRELNDGKDIVFMDNSSMTWVYDDKERGKITANFYDADNKLIDGIEPVNVTVNFKEQ